MDKYRLRQLFLTFVLIGLIFNFPGCNSTNGCSADEAVTDDDGTTDTTEPPVYASQWVAAADWDNAETVTLTLTENSDGSKGFGTSEIKFSAGKAYKLRLTNPAGNGEHHLSSESSDSDFFKAIATRKVETPAAEYRAPYFKKIGVAASADTEHAIDLYFVAVLPGTYSMICDEADHKDAGMKMNFVIEGDPEAFDLTLEVDSAYTTALATDERLSTTHDVWATTETQTVTFKESADLATLSFDPADLTINVDKAYQLTLINPSTNTVEHTYDSADFFESIVTREARDNDGIVWPYYLTSLELLPNNTTGTQLSLYYVPTVQGTYDVTCEETGHAAAGMTGTITVELSDDQLADFCADTGYDSITTCSDATPTFSDVQTIFTASCTGCHSGSAASGSLDLSDGNAYDSLVMVKAAREGATSYCRVDSYHTTDPGNSFLIMKIEGASAAGHQMPDTGTDVSSSPLSSDQMCTVINWIKAGANND